MLKVLAHEYVLALLVYDHFCLWNYER